MNRKNMDRLLMLALPNDGGAGGDGGAGSGDGAGTGGGAGAGAGSGAGGGSGSGDQGGSGNGGPGTDQFKSEESKAAVLADLAAVRDENKLLKDRVTEFENSQLSDEQRREQTTQQVVAERDTAISEAQKEKLRADRYEAAAEAGLSLKYAKRISGSTLEEMIADAKELAKDFGAGEHTPGAGAVGDAGATLSAPGVGTLDSYYAKANSKK